MSKQIYDFLLDKIGNPIGVCALMGNLYVESHLNPELLESSKAKKMGITAKEYADKIDSGEITRDAFCHDGAGYGLAQWTFWSRKQGLYDYVKAENKSIRDLNSQLGYLWKELQGYKAVISALTSATDLRTASDVVALKYEKPEHTEEKYLQNRADYGQKYYDEFAVNIESKGATTMYSVNQVNDKLKELLDRGADKETIIREISKMTVGWPYVFGAWGEECTPANRKKRKRDDHPTIVSGCQVLNGKKSTCTGCKWNLPVKMYDCRGFVNWVFDKVGITIKGQGATSQWNTNDNWVIKGDFADMPKNKICCVFTGTSKTKEHVGIYLGDGSTIECSSGVQYFSPMKSKWKYYAVPKGLYDDDGSLTPSTDDPAGLPTLRQGAKGDIVKTMQQLLANAGSSLAVDGIFGSGTLSAVKAFQKKNDLVIDGIVGPKTWAKLIGYSTVVSDNRLFTVVLKHVPEKEADELLKKYEGSVQSE